MNEFELIRHYFCFSTPEHSYPAPLTETESAVALGIGDDCALLNIPDGRQLAVTTDTLVGGVHFPHDGDPALIARRALRVNLSDLAAMGATPLGFQLALTLPGIDEDWLERFSTGLAEDAQRFSCPLTGGDTTRGPLSITITVMGAVQPQYALRRTGARVGDIICVSGTLGDAACALGELSNDDADDYLRLRYWLPEPRLMLGQLLASGATAGLDISDGLIQDVGHIARANGLSAVIETSRIPLSASLLRLLGEDNARTTALSGGDDYELCFTASEESLIKVERQAAELGCEISRIGQMVSLTRERDDVICVDERGKTVSVQQRGYDHFHDC